MAVLVDPSQLSSPSAARRKTLRKVADESSAKFQILEACPLSKYMDVADRLLEHFCEAADEERLDEAYVLGLRFASLCLQGLPRHPEWSSSGSSAESLSDSDSERSTISTAGTSSSLQKSRRSKLTSKTAVVLRRLAVLKQQMDLEEIAKLSEEARALQQAEARQQESENFRKLQLEEERLREREISFALDREREEFRASQRRIEEAAAAERKSRLRRVYHRIWSN
jgi:hypothetical protein